MKNLVYLSIAEAELIDAAEFYELQRAGLGQRFLDAVATAGRRVRRDPKVWPFRSRAVQSCRVPRFPYRLMYVDETDRVVVVAVAHMSRRPSYWQDRI